MDLHSIAFVIVVAGIASIFILIVGKEPIIEQIFSNRMETLFLGSLILIIPFLLTIADHCAKKTKRELRNILENLYETVVEILDHVRPSNIPRTLYDANRWWFEKIVGQGDANVASDFMRTEVNQRQWNLPEPNTLQPSDFENAFKYLRRRFRAQGKPEQQVRSSGAIDVGVHRPLPGNQFTAVVDEIALRVSGYRLGHIPMMRIETRWPDKTFRMRIMQETVNSNEKKFRGMQDIQIGNPDFDERYILQSNDASTLTVLLADDSCGAIFELGRRIQSAHRNDSLGLISISGGFLQVEWMQEFDSKKQGRLISHVVKQFAEVYQSLLAAEGKLCYEIADLSIDKINSICMVCGESIDEDPVSCSQCKTPHHRDCWSYMGACSTFACGSTVLNDSCSIHEDHNDSSSKKTW